MHFKTLSIHAGHHPRAHQGAVTTPVYQTSTFAFEDVNQPGPFDYSRSGNPTRKVLEDCLAALEGGTRGTGLAAKDPQLANRLAYLQNALGTCAGPQDCFLVLRGIKTLGLRMEEHNRNALAIAHWLERHPKVQQVLHPGLEPHPQHELALRQMTGFGSTFSFRLGGGDVVVHALLRNVRLFTLAESLGGVESLIDHPATMTHASIPVDVRRRMGIGDDLIEDLEQALR